MIPSQELIDRGKVIDGQLVMSTKPKFTVLKDELNRHYTYLIPSDLYTFNQVVDKYWPVWFDGMAQEGIVVLYNGRVSNKK